MKQINTVEVEIINQASNFTNQNNKDFEKKQKTKVLFAENVTSGIKIFYKKYLLIVKKLPKKFQYILSCALFFIGILGIMLPGMPGWGILVLAVGIFSENIGWKFIWLLSRFLKFVENIINYIVHFSDKVWFKKK